MVSFLLSRPFLDEHHLYSPIFPNFLLVSRRVEAEGCFHRKSEATYQEKADDHVPLTA